MSHSLSFVPTTLPVRIPACPNQQLPYPIASTDRHGFRDNLDWWDTETATWVAKNVAREFTTPEMSWLHPVGFARIERWSCRPCGSSWSQSSDHPRWVMRRPGATNSAGSRRQCCRLGPQVRQRRQPAASGTADPNRISNLRFSAAHKWHVHVVPECAAYPPVRLGRCGMSKSSACRSARKCLGDCRIPRRLGW